MIAVGECAVCQGGQVGFRFCPATEYMLLLCEECGLAWMHPSRLGQAEARDPLDPAFARRYPDCRLRGSRWATEDEVKAQGWAPYLMRPADL